MARFRDELIGRKRDGNRYRAFDFDLARSSCKRVPRLLVRENRYTPVG